MSISLATQLEILSFYGIFLSAVPSSQYLHCYPTTLQHKDHILRPSLQLLDFEKDTPRNYKLLQCSTFRSKVATTRIIFCRFFFHTPPPLPQYPSLALVHVYVHVLDFIAWKLRKSLYFRNKRTYFVRACTVSSDVFQLSIVLY